MGIFSRNFQEFLNQNARDPEAMEKRIKWLVENPSAVDGLLAGTLELKSVEVSDWQQLFGGLRVLNLGFNEKNFPLESPTQVVEVITRTYTGIESHFPYHMLIAEARKENLVLAKPRAVGLWLKSHPEVTHEIIGGGEWVYDHKWGDVFIPAFWTFHDHRSVTLRKTTEQNNKNTVWLFSPASRKKIS